MTWRVSMSELGSVTEEIRRDFVYACRRLLRAPGFAFVAIAVLALGIGANTAFFSLVNSVLLKQVSIPLADRLVGVVPAEGGRVEPNWSVSWPLVRQLENRHLSSIEGLTWIQQTRGVFSAAGESRIIPVEAVAGNYFQLLDITPRIGRLSGPADDRDGAPGVIVLSERLWRSWFRAAPDAVGRIVRLSGLPLRRR